LFLENCCRNLPFFIRVAEFFWLHPETADDFVDFKGVFLVKIYNKCQVWQQETPKASNVGHKIHDSVHLPGVSSSFGFKKVVYRENLILSAAISLTKCSWKIFAFTSSGDDVFCSDSLVHPLPWRYCVSHFAYIQWCLPMLWTIEVNFLNEHFHLGLDWVCVIFKIYIVLCSIYEDRWLFQLLIDNFPGLAHLPSR